MTDHPAIRIARWALAFACLLLFVFWPQIVRPNRSEIAATPIPIPIQVLPASTVYVFASATPTAQAAEKLPTLAGTRTPTPTFTPMPTRTPTLDVGTRVPVQRG